MWKSVVVLAALLLGLAHPPVGQAQRCRWFVPDSSYVFSQVQLLDSSSTPPARRDVRYTTSRLSGKPACEVAIAITWDAYARGELLIVGRDGRLLYWVPGRYMSIVKGSNARHVAYSYLAGEGTGVEGYDYAVLCQVHVGYWTDCLHGPKSSSEVIRGSPPLSDSLRLEYNSDSHVELQGDTLVIHRTVWYHIVNWYGPPGAEAARPVTRKDLGITRLPLP